MCDIIRFDTNEDCLFCDFISGKIDKNRIVYQNNYVLAITEQKTMAVFHILLIPKIHISSASAITNENSYYISKIYEAAAKIAEEKNINNYSILHVPDKIPGKQYFTYIIT